MITPGTNVHWDNLTEWISAAHRLDARRSSAKRDRDIASHWNALPLAMIERAPASALRSFIHILQAPNNVAWGKPNRGARRGTKWEALNVAARNRVSRLTRDEALASFGFGHNSRRSQEDDTTMQSSERR